MTNKDLKNAGLKVTLPRVKVLKILESDDTHHISAEEVYRKLVEQGEEVSLATVYRVLTQFEAANLVIRHNFESGHSVFELNQGEHHDHLVCIHCGKVVEFIDETIEMQQESIAKKANFDMTHHSHTIYGICHECRYS